MEMDRIWTKVKNGLREGATLSMEKIEEYTKIGKLKIDELAARRKIDRHFGDIGERTYELIRDGKAVAIDSDLLIKRAAEEVTALRAELAEIAAKISRIQEDARQSRPASAARTVDEEISGV